MGKCCTPRPQFAGGHRNVASLSYDNFAAIRNLPSSSICRHPTPAQLKQGDLFLHLKGPNFNGNALPVALLELGAAYAVIDEAPAQVAGQRRFGHRQCFNFGLQCLPSGPRSRCHRLPRRSAASRSVQTASSP